MYCTMCQSDMTFDCASPNDVDIITVEYLKP